MTTPKGIIIFGATGTGKTTLGRELAPLLGYKHFDLDDYHYHWNTEIPYTELYSKKEKTERLLNDITRHLRFVMSGQMWSIRESFNRFFDLGVFISVPTEVCVERCRARALKRWGYRVRPGGDMYEDSRQQLINAEQYAVGVPPMVCLKRDEQWIAELPCPILRIDGTRPIAENAAWLSEQYVVMKLK